MSVSGLLLVLLELELRIDRGTAERQANRMNSDFTTSEGASWFTGHAVLRWVVWSGAGGGNGRADGAVKVEEGTVSDDGMEIRMSTPT